MLDIITISSAALLGSLLFWFERNDLREKVVGLKLGSGFWTACILLAGACLIREHHVHLLWFAIAFGLFAFVITAPHNILLSHPDRQKITAPRDVIQKLLFHLFAKSVGDPVGQPLYVTYSAIRYAIPVSLMGLTLGNTALIFAGPLCSISMHPWIPGDGWKVYRSAVMGSILVGSLAAGI